MAQALADESGRLVIELHAALQEMDPARWNASAVGSLRDRIEAIRDRLYGLTCEPWAQHADSDDLRTRLVSVSEALRAMPSADGSLGTARSAWMAFRRELVPRYEAARGALSSYAIHVPSLRPTNYRRSFFHALMGTTTLAILYALPDPVWGIAITGGFLVWAWTMETVRRSSRRLNALLMKAFGPVAHPHETNRVNSATWYVTALFLLSLSRSPLVCAIGVAVLGFGDPIAALVGRRFGRIKLVHGRTLEGTLAFFVAGGLIAFGAAWLFAPAVAWPRLLAMAGAGAAAGSLAELLSLRIDDNLSVALAATAAAAATGWALGVPFV
ncbi:MAG: hypothetical protein H6719_29010 [Sandaracinaceae bacterium]|nr:hypothetical protein [Sandaracinaceae bacterium]